MGFVINGQFIICHKFHHANLVPRTYITTASLPLRYEITNKTATASNSTLKQICSTVISEGGYELVGLQQAVGTPITLAKDLGPVGTRAPIVTIRLKADRTDAVVILTALSLLGLNNGTNFRWEVVAAGITAGGSGTWISAGPRSSVEYKLDAETISGGRILAAGYIQGSAQGSTPIDILKEALFKFQLERNSFIDDRFEISLLSLIHI